MREGLACDRHPGMGVYYRSLGPNSRVPGPRLQVVMYDHADQVVRRLEQVRGRCTDEGFVSFFAGDPRNRPAQFLHPIVDIAPDGTQTELISDFPPGTSMSVFHELLARWVATYG